MKPISPSNAYIGLIPGDAINISLKKKKKKPSPNYRCSASAPLTPFPLTCYTSPHHTLIASPCLTLISTSPLISTSLTLLLSSPFTLTRNRTAVGLSNQRSHIGSPMIVVYSHLSTRYSLSVTLFYCLMIRFYMYVP